ncbi:MAG TPA: YdcF family protein [Kofleriaceae bacterium]
MRFAADRLAALLERPLVLRDPFQPLDAIVVLGAPLGPDDALTPILAERVAAAAALWRAGGGRIVVATGGITGRATRPEADAIAAALRDRGVPDVITERASRSTLDNARMTRPLLDARGVRSLWIVSQPYHGRRGARIFRRAGFAAHVWHIDDSLEYRDRGRALRWLVREYAAWLRLFLRESLAWLRPHARDK